MKKIVSILIIFILIFSLSGCSNFYIDNPIKDNYETETTQKTDSSSDIERDTKENQSDNSINADKYNVDISDWEIITISNHPTFWDDLSKAEQIWGKYSKEKICMDGDNYKSTNIICVNSVKNKKIEDIEIYISNFSSSKNVSIDEILPVIATYLPLEMMNGKYACTDSFIAQPKTDTSKDTHYFARFQIQNELDNYEEYFYNMFVEIQVKNGSVQMFRICKGQIPRWTLDLDFNGYDKIEWEYNFGLK